MYGESRSNSVFMLKTGIIIVIKEIFPIESNEDALIKAFAFEKNFETNKYNSLFDTSTCALNSNEIGIFVVNMNTLDQTNLQSYSIKDLKAKMCIFPFSPIPDEKDDVFIIIQLSNIGELEY